MKRIAGLIPALLISACANTGMENSDIAFFAHSQLIGLSKAQILACAGKPAYTDASGDRELLSYSASSGDTTLMIGAGGKVLSNVRNSCDVTYVLRRGYVEDVRFTGARTGGTFTPDEECAVIVRKCVGVRMGDRP